MQSSTNPAEQPTTAQCHGMAVDANNKLIRCPAFAPLKQAGKPLRYHSKGCQERTHNRVRYYGWKLGDVYEKGKRLKYGSHYATEQQLAECRLDPAWEARQKMFSY